MRKIVLFYFTLFICSVGSSTWAENESDVLSLIEESKITINAENIFEIPHIPIIFNETMYQPYEYLRYFQEGLEIDLYLVQAQDELGNDVFHAFSTAQEAASYVAKISAPNDSEATRQTRAARGCEKPYYSYIYWHGLGGWNPHYVFRFIQVPRPYVAYITDMNLCVRWGWAWYGYQCQEFKVQDVEVYAPDHVPNQPNDIWFQKRDVINYCWGDRNECKERIRVCGY